MAIHTIDQPLVFYNLPGPDGEESQLVLRVAEIIPDTSAKPVPEAVASLEVCATGITQVVRNSYVCKFVGRGVLKAHEVRNVVKNPIQCQKDIMQTAPDDAARRVARYFVTSAAPRGDRAVTDPSDIRAVLRLESYKPKLPLLSNPRRQPYPNITNVETWNGQLHEGYMAFDAMALMLAAVRAAHPGHKLAAHTERENPDSGAFFEALGFVDRRQDQVVGVGMRVNPDGGPAIPVHLSTVHMEAAQALDIQDNLRRFLEPSLIA